MLIMWRFWHLLAAVLWAYNFSNSCLQHPKDNVYLSKITTKKWPNSNIVSVYCDEIELSLRSFWQTQSMRPEQPQSWRSPICCICKCHNNNSCRLFCLTTFFGLISSLVCAQLTNASRIAPNVIPNGTKSKFERFFFEVAEGSTFFRVLFFQAHCCPHHPRLAGLLWCSLCWHSPFQHL